jgi:aminopeptidase N
MAVTQFEAIDARRAFPCWDEPALKATFRVKLTIAKDLDGLNNMPVVKEEVYGNKKTLEFDITPIMSTYLVAAAVGHFEFIETKSKRGITVRVYVPPGNIDRSKFSLDVAVKVLDYYEEYFAINYPLPKLDLILVPDFAYTAMENWGLITFEEYVLLCDETSGVNAKLSVAYIVAHEIAHQWFGNLVTMEWWRELWLNEGFATYMGHQVIHDLFPNWNVWGHFSAKYYVNALQLDSLSSSHPVEVEIKNSAEISEIFDDISYSKGAAVIQMLVAFIGEEQFRKGLNIYLNRFQYNNAKTNDLWQALSEASGQNVSRLMNNWIMETGYPYIKITKDQPGGYNVEQNRYLRMADPQANNPIWSFNLSIDDFNGYKDLVEITERKTDLKNTKCKCFKCNMRQTGFYRVLYPLEFYEQFAEEIKQNKVEELDRFGLQNDAFALAKANLLPFNTVLELLRAYENEKSYHIWQDLTAELLALSTLWNGQPTHNLYKKYALDLLQPSITRLGLTQRSTDSDLDKLLRNLLLAAAGYFGHEEIIAESQRLFKQYLTDPQSIHSDMRQMVLNISILNGSKDDFEALLQRFPKADSAEEGKHILEALGNVQDEALLRQYLTFVFTPGNVRDQDLAPGLISAANSPMGLNVLWKFYKENWKVIYERMSGVVFVFYDSLSLTLTNFKTKEMAQEVQNFFADQPISGIERTISQVTEAINAKANQLASITESLNDWFMKK